MTASVFSGFLLLCSIVRWALRFDWRGGRLSISSLFDCMSQLCNTRQTSDFSPASQPSYVPRPFGVQHGKGCFEASFPLEGTPPKTSRARVTGRPWSHVVPAPFSQCAPRNPPVLSLGLSPLLLRMEPNRGWVGCGVGETMRLKDDIARCTWGIRT